jgi:hypothetical protein
MAKKCILTLLWFVVGFSAPANAALNRGDWIGSAGLGVMVSPSLFLVSPQIEYVYRRNVFLGPLLQAGLGSGGALIGASFTGRVMLGQNPRLRPNMEGGIGLVASSGLFSGSIGILLHVGMGFDFLLDEKLSLGTIIRANFAPPIQTFVFSWPIFTVRYIL